MTLKRYNLALPQELWNEIEQLAQERRATVLSVIRQFIQLGLILEQAKHNPSAEIVLRTNGKEQVLILL